MNKIVKIIAGLAAVASLAACSQKAEYKTYPYVRLNADSYTYAEDAGTVTIPVYVYADGAERTDKVNTEVSFVVTDGTAKAGINYSVEPASGVLSFDGTSEAKITVKIVDLPGEYTSDLNFSIEITGASNGFTLGGLTGTTVTIKDNDHPLANILGTYKTGTVADNWGDEYVITSVVAPVAGSTSEVTVTNLCPYSLSQGYAHTLTGVISDDHKTLTLTSPQSIYSSVLLFVGVQLSGNTLSIVDKLVLNIDEEAHTLTTVNGFGAYVNQASAGWYDLFPEAGIVFTKQ